MSIDHQDGITQIFAFLHQVEQLKSTLRFNQTATGRQESSAEHSWRLALLSFLVADDLGLDLDRERVMKLALVHDLPEALVGDVDAFDVASGKVPKEKKYQQELEAMRRLSDLLPEGLGEELFLLWNEYEDAESKEARYIKALDKIETVAQLIEMGCEKWGHPDFVATYPDKAVENAPELSVVLKTLKQELKEEFQRGGLEWEEEYETR